MLTLAEYLKIAEKIIIKQGHSYLLKDEDAISCVAEYMMKADHSFNGTGNAYGWRAKHGEYGLMNYLREIRRKRKILSLDFKINDIKSMDYLSFSDNPSKICENKEMVNNMLSVLTKREKKCIIGKFVEERTLQSIGDDFGISRERIRQIINTAIGKIKEKYNE